ncbi:hypothetical protein HDU97_001225, partial [Phlyctochytrium planicorne]
MIIARLLQLLALLAGAASSASAAGLSIKAKGPTALKGTYLVELPHGVDPESHVRSYLLNSGLQDQEISIRTTINTTLFNGISFSLPE